MKALINLCVPFRTIERGWQGILPLVAQEIYPPDEFQFRQWEFMKRSEEDFEQTVEWIKKDIEGFCKSGLQPTTPPSSRHFTQMWMSGPYSHIWVVFLAIVYHMMPEQHVGECEDNRVLPDVVDDP